MDELLGLAIRISIMYVYILAVFRLSGKRSVANLTPLDFLVALILGDLFDDVFWAEVPLSQGLVAATTILLWQVLVAFAEYKSDRIKHLVSSKETPIVRLGNFVEENLRRERTPTGSVLMELRMLGEDKDDLSEIKEAFWEPSGQLSVLKREEAKTAEKRDLPRLQELLR